jgi:hypothetical protein
LTSLTYFFRSLFNPGGEQPNSFTIWQSLRCDVRHISRNAREGTESRPQVRPGPQDPAAAQGRSDAGSDWKLRLKVGQRLALNTYKDPDLPTDQKLQDALAILQNIEDKSEEEPS